MLNETQFFLTLLHLIHLGMQSNRCGPGQTIKDISSQVCVSVSVCMSVCRETTKAGGMREFRNI